MVEDVVQREISFPIIPESFDKETRSYHLRIQEILQEALLGASYISSLAVQELSMSSTGAFWLPRMTTTQRDALTASNGMLIYNTTTNQFEGYENGAWADL